MRRRVLSARIAHETNTFSIRPTRLAAYRAGELYRGEVIQQKLGGTRTEIGAHLDFAEAHGWDLIQPICAWATPSGKTTADTWTEISDALIDACIPGSVDGVLLSLHGAMATETEDDAEGALLARIRRCLGESVPIAVTLDLHANVSDAMVHHADIVVAYRTYPHVDMYETAMEAADLLNRAMFGHIAPTPHVVRGPLLFGCDLGRTQGGPMSRLLARAEKLRDTTPGVLTIAICAGFPWADTPFSGPSVTVTGDGESDGYRWVSQTLYRAILESHAETTVTFHSIDQAMHRIRRRKRSPRPIILADATDNPGGGGYGDHVGLLRALLDTGVTGAAIGCIADPDVVTRCAEVGTGADITVDLGAKVDPALYGPPLRINATVTDLTDGYFVYEGPREKGATGTLGKTAVLNVEGNHVIVASHNRQVFDQAIFRSQGIEPADCSVVIVKSAHHFRAAFEPIAEEVIVVDSGALVTNNLASLPYRKVRRPVWPLDERCQTLGLELD
ncbi:MAG: M81 family metallopeptidase [Alphaproteobacteria bacterium]|nr:M81 family metallopeptidase [Alphaproteobacteria bacterium]